MRADSAANSATVRESLRRQDIELLRIVSAFGIVWFHSEAPGGPTAYAGLIVFLVLSTYLARRTSDPPRLSSIQNRARRLLVPWAVWFLAYGALNVARGDAFLDTRVGVVPAVMSGTSIHLWYLPFVFLCLNAVDLLNAHVASRTAAWFFGASALALTAAAPIWRPITLALPYPNLQWADALAPVAFGLFLQNASALPQPARRAVLATILASAAAASAFNSVGVSYALGFAACAVIATGITAHWTFKGLQRFADLTFGIYLCHILVFAGLLRYTDLPGEAMPFLIFALSAVAVAAGRAIAPGLRSYWS
jgi:peptidoglycan/LPS O-acetylase OafA/YrhL